MTSSELPIAVAAVAKLAMLRASRVRPTERRDAKQATRRHHLALLAAALPPFPPAPAEELIPQTPPIRSLLPSRNALRPHVPTLLPHLTHDILFIKRAGGARNAPGYHGQQQSRHGPRIFPVLFKLQWRFTTQIRRTTQLCEISITEARMVIRYKGCRYFFHSRAVTIRVIPEPQVRTIFCHLYFPKLNPARQTGA
jgi:hypothetical protein